MTGPSGNRLSICPLRFMLPAHFHAANGDVVTKLGITVASCYALCSLVVLVSYSCSDRILLVVWYFSFLDCSCISHWTPAPN